MSLLVLATGSLVYLVDRSGSVLPAWCCTDNLPNLFGAVGLSLPTFAHVFGFSVLTALVLSLNQKSAANACVSWFLVDAAFEAGQHPAFDALFVPLSNATSGIPLIASAVGYFTYGTFDLWDLLSILAGAVSAYLVVRGLQQWRCADG